METLNLNLSDTNEFKFKSFKSEFVNQFDVYHKGNRVAIINGIDGALLRWVCNSDKITIKNVIKLEKMVEKAFNKYVKTLY